MSLLPVSEALQRLEIDELVESKPKGWDSRSSPNPRRSSGALRGARGA